MGTKWKKCKAVVSFCAFAAGTSLVLGNLPGAAAIAYVLRDQDLTKPADYQKSAEFRYIIEEKLNDLLGVATGGQGWYTGIGNDVYVSQYGYDGGLVGWLDRSLNAGNAVNETVAEAVEEGVVVEERADAAASTAAEISLAEVPAADYERYLQENGLSADSGYGVFLQERGLPANDASFNEYLMEQAAVYGDEFVDAYMMGGDSGNFGIYYDEDGSIDKEKTMEAYMYGLAQDKNILYAIVGKGELLYTNIDGLSEKTGKPWDGGDFGELLPDNVYNFQLWFNKAGDGKVQMMKDGKEQDVYGDGVYRSGNDWRVPGYANFTLGKPAKEAVVFLAAAKEPQLYLVGNYDGDGVSQYGGNLYYLNESVTFWSWKFMQRYWLLMAGAVLLLLALLMHKSLKTAFGGIMRLFGKIPLPVKTVLFVIVAVLTVVPGADAIGQVSWYIQDAIYIGGDAVYLHNNLRMASICLAVWFFLILWAAADGRTNVARQLQEAADRRRMREFKYPLQKRLVRRDRNRLFWEGGVLLLFISALLILYLLFEAYIRVNFWMWQGNDALEGIMKFPLYVILAAFFTLAVFMVFIAIDVCRLRKTRRFAEDIGALSDRIAAVKDGALAEEWKLPEDSDLREAAENLNEIRTGLETALSEQIKSERMKVDLVTNVSHDIKTPLTSIISYVELLRQEEELPQHVKEYVQILGEKSERLKGIVQDVFEVSKATSGQLPMRIEVLDLGKLLRQTLADMGAQIEESSLMMRPSIPKEPVSVKADGQRLYRVFQNLIQNALKYSLEGSRIYLTLVSENDLAVVRIKNTSSVELVENKDFTERFVRGDDSRTDGGSGLGLSIAKSFTEACGGSFLVETDADLFTVTVSFPEAGQEQTVETPEMPEPEKEEALAPPEEEASLEQFMMPITECGQDADTYIKV